MAERAMREIKRRLHATGEELGLRIDAQREAVFSYMHRIIETVGEAKPR
jgi:predicted amino acid-binding ACT domain protein